MFWPHLAILVFFLVAWHWASRKPADDCERPRCQACGALMEADWLDDDWHCIKCGFEHE